VRQWPIGDVIPSGLSVDSSYNVLVTCYLANRIKVYTTNGALLKDINLAASIVRPMHAVEIAADQYVVMWSAMAISMTQCSRSVLWTRAVVFCTRSVEAGCEMER